MPASQRSITNALAGVGATLVLVVGGLGLLGTASAATPTSGTLSDATPSVSWTGAPLPPANPTGTILGTPVCGPQVCDDYTLHVSVPSGYDATHTIHVTVAGQAGGDYDVYVLDSAGKTVATGDNAGDEDVTVPAVSGDYTVRVLAFEQV
ncbi:MAG: hypothetical protein ACXVWZ_12955, partial [Nocardioides sp.]